MHCVFLHQPKWACSEACSDSWLVSTRPRVGWLVGMGGWDGMRDGVGKPPDTQQAAKKGTYSQLGIFLVSLLPTPSPASNPPSLPLFLFPSHHPSSSVFSQTAGGNCR